MNTRLRASQKAATELLRLERAVVEAVKKWNRVISTPPVLSRNLADAEREMMIAVDNLEKLEAEQKDQRECLTIN